MKVGHVAISSAHSPQLLLSHFYNGNKNNKKQPFSSLLSGASSGYRDIGLASRETLEMFPQN